MLKINTLRGDDRLFSWTRSGRALFALNLLAIAGLGAASGILLWKLRCDAGDRARTAAQSLVQVLGRDVARNIEIYDLALRTVQDGMLLPSIKASDPETRQLILFERAARARNFGHTLVMDRRGDLIATSQSTRVPSINYMDRSYFKYHESTSGDELHVTGPLTSRFIGKRVLVLSRRMIDKGGNFSGVVNGSLYLDYFRELFSAAGRDHMGTITLVGPEGRVLMREPYAEAEIGATVLKTASYQRMGTALEGHFRGEALLEQGAREFVFTQIGDLPLKISIEVDPAKIYGEWQRTGLAIGAVVLVLCAMTILLNGLFSRELTRRRRAEDAAAGLNAALRDLADRDGLTGVFNRRYFDELLSREMVRLRESGHFSLILLDVDYFKDFNDRFGHQHGDEALKRVARTIAEMASRPEDAICRYGGEEFAVVLPATDVAGAAVLAERIRRAIAAERWAHPTSPYGILTVSCGVAQATGSDTTGPESVIRLADSALYAAKGDGRNRVEVARPNVPISQLVSA